MADFLDNLSNYSANKRYIILDVQSLKNPNTKFYKHQLMAIIYLLHISEGIGKGVNSIDDKLNFGVLLITGTVSEM